MALKFKDRPALLAAIQAAYEVAPDLPAAHVFDPRTGKQKKRVTRETDYMGKICVSVRAEYPYMIKEAPTITFKDDTTEYTVYNTRPHLRILAERLGLVLGHQDGEKLPVWIGCNGAKKNTPVKVWLYEDWPEHYPVYGNFPPPPSGASLGSRPVQFYWLVEGRLLEAGRSHSEIPLKKSSLIDAVKGALTKHGLAGAEAQGLLTRELVQALGVGL